MIRQSLAISWLSLIVIVVCQAQYLGPSGDRLYAITDINGEGKLVWGFINAKGEVVAEPKYDVAIEFGDGVAVLREQTNSYLVNSQGEIKKVPGVEIITRFSEGIAIAKDGRGRFIIDTNGKRVAMLPPESNWEDADLFALPFSNGLAPVSTKSGIGFINRSGRFVIAPQFDSTSGFSCGFAPVVTTSGWGLIDTSGQFIVPPNREEPISEISDGLAIIQELSGGWKFVNKFGVVLESDHNLVGGFSEGLAAFQDKSSNLWGFMDKSGTTVIEPKFRVVKPFSNGVAGVVNYDNWGFIDRTGKFVVEPKIDHVITGFRGKLAYVYDEGFEGYIDMKGNWVWRRQRK